MNPFLAVALAAALAGGWALACRQPPIYEVVFADMERAQGKLRPFKQQLLAALLDSLGEGPESAIQVCREKAPLIAAELSIDGVEMGRTSHRLRNPANAPAAWIEPLLADYVASAAAVAPRLVPLAGDRLGYVEPIRIIDLCVGCHGADVEADLLDLVRALYPDDEATGFRVGDFRGLFWITMPATADGG